MCHSTIESAELQRWLQQVHPRARTEAYPLLLLTKDILQRVATDKLTIINSEIDDLKRQLRQVGGGGEVEEEAEVGEEEEEEEGRGGGADRAA